MKPALLLIFYLTFQISAFSQEIIGHVKAADTREPIPYAFIKNNADKKITPSDVNGAFKLINVQDGAKISISSVGYQTKEIELSANDSVLNIFLEPSILNIGEVNVYASKSRMQTSSLETLKNAETYSLAGTTKDIFRSIQMLPGVSSNNAASAQYNVRGGTYDENLMLINGIEVAEPYHIKVFPMASLGIFNIDMVQRIDFSSGGFSAEYGDALSSVMNVDYRKANNDSVCGRINLGMIDLGVQAEIPFSKKTSLILAGRHSYLDPVIKTVDVGQKVSIRYYDIQSKFDYRINNRNEISVLGIYSQDYDKVGPDREVQLNTFSGKFHSKPITINQTEKNSFLLDSRYNDLLLAVLSKHNIGGKILVNAGFSFYREKENTPQLETDSVTSEFSVPELFYRNYYFWESIKAYDLMSYEFKLSARILVSPGHTLKAGGYIRKTNYDYKNSRTTFWDIYNNTEKYPDTLKYINRPEDAEENSDNIFKADAIKIGSYVSYSWQVNPKAIFTVGCREDYFSLNKEFTLSPRVNLLYSISKDWTANAAWGIYHKTPLMKQLQYSFATSSNTKSQQAAHYILGISRVHGDKTFKAEAYYKKYDRLIAARRSVMSEVIYERPENNATGYATGTDFEYIVTKSRFNLWLIYSFLIAKEKLDSIDSYYSRYTDQRHTISALFVYKMRNSKQFDVKLTYGSGYAFQTKVYNSVQKHWVAPVPIQTKHLPYYLSIDLRFKKEFKFKGNPLQFYVDVMNVLNRKNVLGHRYKMSNNTHYEEDFSFLGILPTFGLIYDF